MRVNASPIAVEEALQGGDPHAALSLLEGLVADGAERSRLRRIAEETLLALLERPDIPAACQLFRLFPGLSERTLFRLAVALIEAGEFGEAAEVAAALQVEKWRQRVFGRALRVVGERPGASAVLLAVVAQGGALPGQFRKAVEALAQAGEADAARLLLARAAISDPVEAGLCEGALLHGEGRLEEARRRIAPLAAAASAGSPVLAVAQDWALQAHDLDAAADLAERALPPEPALPPPGRCLTAAKLLAECGRHGAAWHAVQRARRALSAMERQQEALSDADRARAAHAALSFADLDTASRLAEPLPAENVVRQAVRAVAWACGAHPPSRLFMDLAARAWADPEAAFEEALAADIAIICPARMSPSVGFGRWTDGTAPPIGEQGVCHRALVRTMELAEEAGLRVALVPSPGFVVPPALIERRRFFVSYHSVSAPAFGVHVKGGPLPDTLLLEPTGYSGWASLCARPLDDIPLDDVDDAEAAAWREREVVRLASRNISKWTQRPRAAAALPSGPAVLVALQIPSDRAMRHAWVDMYDLARAVVRGFRGRGVTVMLKRHPQCTDPRTDALFRELRPEPGVVVTDASVHDLLPAVRAVYCVNSGLGAEALLYGRAVHVAGLADYRHACHEVRTLDDLRTDEGAFTPPLPQDALCRYIYWYRNIHHVPLDQRGALDEAIRARILEPAASAR